MNLLADESVDAPIVERLRRDGHRVAYVAEMSPSIPDAEVLERATMLRVRWSPATRILANSSSGFTG